MKAFFHAAQNNHIPKTFFSRGKMRQPQEVPERTERMLDGLKAIDVPIVEPSDLGAGPIARIHDLGYLRFLESAHRRWMEMDDWGDEVMSNIFVRAPNAMRGILAEAGRYIADGSSPIGAHTWEAVYWGAQVALAAANAVMSGERTAYGLCRPPGHHARRDAAGGFCYLNNAAIAAQHMTARFPRIAILDVDMHHGQGVQEIFYNRSDVLYISIHGDTTNFYPVVTGFEGEKGEGEGYGYNINMPMPHGSTEEHFFQRVEEAMTAIRLYEPDALVVPLGFDTYYNDPQAKVAVTTEGFQRLGNRISRAGLPTVVLQEGGYAMEALSINVQHFFRGLNS